MGKLTSAGQQVPLGHLSLKKFLRQAWCVLLEFQGCVMYAASSNNDLITTE